MVGTSVIQIETWPLVRFVPYFRNPRKNDHAVERMAASIREFGFRMPVLARSSGDVIDGHLRLKAAQKLGMSDIPVIICDDWTDAQVKAFRLLVNRSVNWADWDTELLSLELSDLKGLDFDLDLTGFDEREIEDLLSDPDLDVRANQVPDVPENPVTIPGDLWRCGPHRILCADATRPEAVAHLLGGRKPFLMVTDPPYGISLDSEWRDRAGLNSCGPAEASYMKQRTEGHTATTISGDTRADWSKAFELVPSIQVAYVWHASLFTREVLDGLLRIGLRNSKRSRQTSSLRASCCDLRDLAARISFRQRKTNSMGIPRWSQFVWWSRRNGVAADESSATLTMQRSLLCESSTDDP